MVVVVVAAAAVAVAVAVDKYNNPFHCYLFCGNDRSLFDFHTQCWRYPLQRLPVFVVVYYQ